MHISECEDRSGRRIITLSLTEKNLLGLLAKVHDSQHGLTHYSDDGSVLFVVKGEPNPHQLERRAG